MKTRHVLAAIAVTIGAIFACGYWLGYRNAPREILDEDVIYTGPQTVDTTKVLSATVESLRAQSRLTSYTYRGTSIVRVERTKWMIFGGRQQLTIPADVSYFVDLSTLQNTDVSFDPGKNEITVLLPALMLTVAFDPFRADEINEGLLTMNDEVVQELRKLNYESARKALIKQGQQAEFVRLAKENMQKSIVSFFDVALAVAGKNAAQVNVQFKLPTRQP